MKLKVQYRKKGWIGLIESEEIPEEDSRSIKNLIKEKGVRGLRVLLLMNNLDYALEDGGEILNAWHKDSPDGEWILYDFSIDKKHPDADKAYSGPDAPVDFAVRYIPKNGGISVAQNRAVNRETASEYYDGLEDKETRNEYARQFLTVNGYLPEDEADDTMIITVSYKLKGRKWSRFR